MKKFAAALSFVMIFGILGCDSKKVFELDLGYTCRFVGETTITHTRYHGNYESKGLEFKVLTETGWQKIFFSVSDLRVISRPDNENVTTLAGSEVAKNGYCKEATLFAPREDLIYWTDYINKIKNDTDAVRVLPPEPKPEKPVAEPAKQNQRKYY